MTPERLEIPSGLVTVFTVGRVVLEAALLMVLFVGVPWIAFKHLYALIPAVPIWGWLAYHSTHEPLFLKFWSGQLTCKPYYHG